MPKDDVREGTRLRGGRFVQRRLTSGRAAGKRRYGASANAAVRLFAIGSTMLGLTAIAGTNALARAGNVPVKNPDFAKSSVAPDHYNSGRVVEPGKDKIIPDWGIGSTGGYAAAGIHNNGGTPTQYAAYTGYTSTVIYQDVGALLPNRHYTLSVFVRENPGRWGVGSTGQIALVNTRADANTKTQTFKGRLLGKASVVVSSPGVILSTSVTTGKSVSGDMTIELSVAKPGTSAKTGTEVQFTAVKLSSKPAGAGVAHPAKGARNGTAGAGVLGRGPSGESASSYPCVRQSTSMAPCVLGG